MGEHAQPIFIGYTRAKGVGEQRIDIRLVRNGNVIPDVDVAILKRLYAKQEPQYQSPGQATKGALLHVSIVVYSAMEARLAAVRMRVALENLGYRHIQLHEIGNPKDPAPANLTGT